MPASLRAWYTPADFEALAARQAELVGEFAVENMGRLAEHVGAQAGTVSAAFAFSRHDAGWIRLVVSLQATLSVTCQRCLGPLELEITEDVEFGVVDTDASASLVPEDLETVVLDGDRFSPQSLVEDEMIMAVPLVPKHAAEQCAVDADSLPDGVFADSGTSEAS
jgi:uncharacterized protein